MARKKAGSWVLCAKNKGYPASLEIRKVYKALSDPDAEAHGFIRVVDESGDDYLYPSSLFVAVELPPAAAKALQPRPRPGRPARKPGTPNPKPRNMVRS
jgi:hypothetical protein